MDQVDHGTRTFVAGIDVGGTKILMMLGDETGRVVDKRRLPLPENPAPDVLFSLIADQIHDSLKQQGAASQVLAGIGIGLPGVVDAASGIADNCTALGWGRVDVRKGLEALTHCPVFVDNDVLLAAIGEGWTGAARQVQDYVLLAVGTGIGSAIVSGGRLVRGSRFAAGEIGYFVQHDTFDDDFKQDYSGFGSLELAASGSGITARAREYLELYEGPTLIKDRFGATAETVRAEHVLQAASEQDELALTILKLPMRHLAMAIANIASLLNPELIVIGGGVADSGSFYVQTLQQLAEKLSPNPVKLVSACLGNEAGAIGAIHMVLSNGIA